MSYQNLYALHGSSTHRVSHERQQLHVMSVVRITVLRNMIACSVEDAQTKRVRRARTRLLYEEKMIRVKLLLLAELYAEALVL